MNEYTHFTKPSYRLRSFPVEIWRGFTAAAEFLPAQIHVSGFVADGERLREP
jgi:hypothetical protein